MAAQATSANAKSIPRIYVASLADYNAGRLHGVWVEAIDVAKVRASVVAMLRESPSGDAEEYAIHGVAGFGAYLPTELADLEVVCAIGAAVDELGLVFAGYVEHAGAPSNANGVAALVLSFKASYQGEYETLEDWAEQYLENSGVLRDLPETLRYYVDFESWAQDAELNGDILALECLGSVHVFWSR